MKPGIRPGVNSATAFCYYSTLGALALAQCIEWHTGLKPPSINDDHLEYGPRIQVV